jgi:hypothetical protein
MFDQSPLSSPLCAWIAMPSTSPEPSQQPEPVVSTNPVVPGEFSPFPPLPHLLSLSTHPHCSPAHGTQLRRPVQRAWSLPRPRPGPRSRPSSASLASRRGCTRARRPGEPSSLSLCAAECPCAAASRPTPSFSAIYPSSCCRLKNWPWRRKQSRHGRAAPVLAPSASSSSASPPCHGQFPCDNEEETPLCNRPCVREGRRLGEANCPVDPTPHGHFPVRD